MQEEAIVVGAGPNGLAAAIELARAGISVAVVEAEPTPGGGARTEALTLPGFAHDTCSAIHPLGALSPFLQTIPFADDGVEWIEPPLALAHPLGGDVAATLERGVEATAAKLGPDGDRWRALFGPLDARPRELFADILRPIRIPSHPFAMARFGFYAVQSARGLAEGSFTGAAARALFAGCSAHAMTPLETPGSASFGLVLMAAAHAVGWPLPKRGSVAITEALVRELERHGGTVRTSERVTSLAPYAHAKAILFDVMPKQVAAIAGDALPATYADALRRYRHGPGVFKVDWALDGPIPWTAEACHRAGTVHVGGTLDEIAASERAPHEDRVTSRPFVLVTQQSLFDETRAPAGCHTGWAYCHVPNGANVDMTDVIEAQIERFAPGFRKTILARHVMSPKDVEAHDASFVGGDIGSGMNDLYGTIARPVPRWNPYTTPNPRLFHCSSATPPGGGVHGMCGYWAAHAALDRVFSGRRGRSARDA